MPEHTVVDSDPLVRQRIDAGDLGGKGRVGQVAEGKPFALHQGPNHLGPGSEVEQRRFGNS